MGGKTTDQERAANRLMRGVYFLAAAFVVPAGLYGYLTQGIVAALLVSVLGLGCGALWWWLRPRPASADARRWQHLCGALTIAATAGLELTAVLFLRSPASEVSLQTLTPTLIAGALTLPVVVLRVVAGRKLRGLTVRDDGPTTVASPAQQEKRLTADELQAGAGSPDGGALEKGADGSLTLRPNPSRLPKLGTLAALPLAILGAVRLLLLGWLGVVILVSIVVLAAGAGMLIRRQRAFHSFARLTPSTLTVKPWYRPARSLPREAVSRVVVARANLGLGFGQPDQALMLFLGGDGRCLLSLNCLGIPLSGAGAFAGALGVPVSARPDRMGPNELRRDYPGSVSAYFSHQVAFSVGATLALVALVTGGVIGWAALTGQFATAKPVALGVTQAERASGRQSSTAGDEVTVTRVDNPARASIPAAASEPGTHFVGVAVRVKNTGAAPIPPPDVGTAVRDSRGASYRVDRLDDPSAAQLNSDADVGPGSTENAYVLIRVADAAIPRSVEFDTGGGDDELSWVVPPQPAPPTPNPAALGQALSLGGQQVTVLGVDDPAHGYPAAASVPDGDHLVGVEMRIVNTGRTDSDPPYEPLSVVDAQGGRRDEVNVSATAGPAENPVRPGQRVTTTVFFDVPAGTRVAEVDYEYRPAGLTAGGGHATAAWTAPAPSGG